MFIKLTSLITFLSVIFQYANADLRMASSPKKDFIVRNGKNSIPYVQNSIAIYMEPSTFNYQGLENQRDNNYDNFLRSNIDNEQDNRNFDVEPGRDMLPFRTLEGNSIANDIITATVGQQTLIPLRWNNPHSSECEINIWTKNNAGNDIVIPIKKPSCCGEGYQDNMIAFTIPADFNELGNKIPGFLGCAKVGDCTLQIYAHSVEPRTYAIGTPIIINGNVANIVPAQDNSKIEPATVDPQLNLNYLQNDICVPTTDNSTNIANAIPRFARLVSDQFNHAYQNSNFSPYSGQQHESISRNLQASTILRMTAANGGELGQSIINSENTEFINNLINKVNNVVTKYEEEANDIFNMIKEQYKFGDTIGNQQLANCFRCSDTGSVNTNRIEQKTYIPSFEIKDSNIATQIRNSLSNEVANLIPPNSNNVQIYMASLNELSTDFANAAAKGFNYQPAMLKSTLGTMEDPTNFIKVNLNGRNDEGVYAATSAINTKIANINNITISFLENNFPSTTSIPQTTSKSPPLTTKTITNTFTPGNTLPPNPDDFPQMPSSNFCGQTYETVDCTRPCPSGLNDECIIDFCFSAPNLCNTQMP
jgi:hypothetical protein